MQNYNNIIKRRLESTITWSNFNYFYFGFFFFATSQKYKYVLLSYRTFKFLFIVIFPNYTKTFVRHLSESNKNYLSTLKDIIT